VDEKLWGLSSRVSEFLLTASITDQMFDPKVGSLPLMGSVLSLLFSPFFVLLSVCFSRICFSQKCVKLSCWFSSGINYGYNTSLYMLKDVCLFFLFSFFFRNCIEAQQGQSVCYILLVCDG